MRISDWSSDVCSSDLIGKLVGCLRACAGVCKRAIAIFLGAIEAKHLLHLLQRSQHFAIQRRERGIALRLRLPDTRTRYRNVREGPGQKRPHRSEERRVGKECVSTWSSRWSADH